MNQRKHSRLRREQRIRRVINIHKRSVRIEYSKPRIRGFAVVVDIAAHIDEPSGCSACGAIAGCCVSYPNCPGNPDFSTTAAKPQR